MVKLANGDKPRAKTSLCTAIDSLRATLLLPASKNHSKFSKDVAPLTTIIHPTWLPFIQHNELPPHTTNSYATLEKTSSYIPPTPKRLVIHTFHTFPTSKSTKATPLDIVEKDDFKIPLH